MANKKRGRGLKKLLGHHDLAKDFSRLSPFVVRNRTNFFYL